MSTESLSRQFRVNCDSDGCVYDYTGNLYERASRHFSRTEPWPVPREWDQASSMGIDPDAFWKFFHESVEGLFSTGNPIEGAIPVLKRLSKKHRLRIITHKHLRVPESTAHAMRDTISFYESHGLLQNVELIFPRSAYEKQGFPAEVVIDDKPSLGWVQPNAVNILFDQPWNESISLKPGVIRAYGWAEVEAIVKSAYSGWKLMRNQVESVLAEASN